jgi:hypothetical protein
MCGPDIAVLQTAHEFGLWFVGILWKGGPKTQLFIPYQILLKAFSRDELAHDLEMGIKYAMEYVKGLGPAPDETSVLYIKCRNLIQHETKEEYWSRLMEEAVEMAKKPLTHPCDEPAPQSDDPHQRG